MADLAGEKVAIVGLGASGEAAATLARKRGGEVYVSDLRAEAPTRARGDRLRSLGIDVELGGHDVERIARADSVVVSPGIPPDAPVLRKLRDLGVGWISELELAFRFFSGPLIAVTGTNGKTTTAALTAHLLEASGLQAGLGGNIGAGLGPAASELALREPAPDWFVVEVSSFQLADIRSFRPDIGVVTNLAPDHLDRYPDLESYYGDKARLFENATPACRWVLQRSPEVGALAGDAPGERYWFSTETSGFRGAWMWEGTLTLDVGDGEEALVGQGELAIPGRHNAANALAASLAARLAGAEKDAIARGLRSFRPLPHRMELVEDREGVRWVNDSKATNVAAARNAVESLAGPLVVLLGGKDKGEDFGALAPSLMERARTVVVYGAARKRILEAVRDLPGRGVTLVRVEGSFEEAVATARREARRGDTVLLAPACSSYDMFESFEERGRRFAELAREED